MFARFGAVSVFGCAAMYVASEELVGAVVATGLVKVLIGGGALVFGKFAVGDMSALSNSSVGVLAFGVAALRKALLSPARPGPEAAAKATNGVSFTLPLV